MDKFMRTLRTRIESENVEVAEIEKVRDAQNEELRDDIAFGFEMNVTDIVIAKALNNYAPMRVETDNCPWCSHAVSHGDNFCSQCGQALLWGKEEKNGNSKDSRYKRDIEE